MTSHEDDKKKPAPAHHQANHNKPAQPGGKGEPDPMATPPDTPLAGAPPQEPEKK